MRPWNILKYVGFGFIIGFFILIDPFRFCLFLTLAILFVLIITSPYIGIIMLILFSPFQPYIRDIFGSSMIRFWREGYF